MTTYQYEAVSYLMTLIFFLELIFCGLHVKDGFAFLNPLRNYNKWTMFNWFGIILITIILNIIFAPWSVMYWLYKLCTVGRK